jgi:hypothetical protein
LPVWSNVKAIPDTSFLLLSDVISMETIPPFQTDINNGTIKYLLYS